MTPRLRLPDAVDHPVPECGPKKEYAVQHLLLKIHDVHQRCCGNKEGRIKYGMVEYCPDLSTVRLISDFYMEHLTLIRKHGLWKGTAYGLSQDPEYKDRITTMIPKDAKVLQ